MVNGMIFDIQRFALHDGPGIRTTVFLKGCSNRCEWCHNPESYTPEAQLEYFPLRCTYCMRCKEACPVGAHVFADGSHGIDRAKCTMCGSCRLVCYADALVMTGREVSVGDVAREVMEDAPYYETSGGGVTLSGGEPVLQHEFSLEILKTLKGQGVHTNIQTAGNYPFDMLAPLLPYLDMVMYDVKAISENIYDEHIHGDRGRILTNLSLLDGATEAPLVVRTPIIAGVNATEDEIVSIARYIKPLKHLESYRLIPYHGLGRAKSDALGKTYNSNYAMPSARDIAALELAAARYVPVYNLVKGMINPSG